MELVDAASAAKRCHISEETLMKWTQSGHAPHYFVEGHGPLYDEDGFGAEV